LNFLGTRQSSLSIGLIGVGCYHIQMNGKDYFDINLSVWTPRQNVGKLVSVKTFLRDLPLTIQSCPILIFINTSFPKCWTKWWRSTEENDCLVLVDTKCLTIEYDVRAGLGRAKPKHGPFLKLLITLLLKN
jgi:hypothetical protein